MTTEEQHDNEELPGLEAHRVKFTGASWDLTGIAPEIDDRMTYLVVTQCSAAGRKRMKDGELRRLRDMDLLEVIPQGEPVKPDPTPAEPVETTPSLFPDDEEGVGDMVGHDNNHD